MTETKRHKKRAKVTRKRDCKTSQDCRLGLPQGNVRLRVWISPAKPVQTCWLALSLVKYFLYKKKHPQVKAEKRPDSPSVPLVAYSRVLRSLLGHTRVRSELLSSWEFLTFLIHLLTNTSYLQVINSKSVKCKNLISVTHPLFCHMDKDFIKRY